MKESIKVSAEILNKVRALVKKTNQKVGGYYDIAVEEKLAKEKISEKIKGKK